MSQKGRRVESHAVYEILDEIGKGSYGIVFLAKHRELGRRAAIKVLSSGKETLSDLRKEAWVQGILSHPNIISVYDFITLNEDGSLVMEYVERSLQSVLEKSSLARKPVPLRFALKVIRDCLNGLAYAHDVGVVHGDIKPANILIGDNDEAKLSDFGVSRILGTALKTKKGSARWAAPEVLKRWNQDKVWAADYQSDLFSLGVVAYVLLTGNHPFIDSAGVLSIEQVILRDEATPLRPSRATEIIPERYVSATMKLLQRNKRQRYTSAREVLDDLQEQPMSPCLNCGEQNPEDASFCNWCGGNLKVDSRVIIAKERRILFKVHDLFAAGKVDEGIAEIARFLGTKKNSAWNWCGIGFRLNSFGWYSDAVIACTEAIKLDSNLATAYQTRGFAKSNLGEFEDSIPDFDKALELTQEEDKRARSRILYQRGYALMRMNKKAKACKDATESIRLDPTYERAVWLARVSCGPEFSKIYS